MSSLHMEGSRKLRNDPLARTDGAILTCFEPLARVVAPLDDAGATWCTEDETLDKDRAAAVSGLSGATALSFHSVAMAEEGSAASAAAFVSPVSAIAVAAAAATVVAADDDGRLEKSKKEEAETNDDLMNTAGCLGACFLCFRSADEAGENRPKGKCGPCWVSSKMLHTNPGCSHQIVLSWYMGGGGYGNAHTNAKKRRSRTGAPNKNVRA